MPIDYYRQFRGRPEGPRTYDAGNLPRLSYNRYNEATKCHGVPQQWTLSHEWLEAGQPLSPTEQGPPTSSDLFDEHPRPLDHVAVKAALLTQGRYVAVVTLSWQCDYHIA